MSMTVKQLGQDILDWILGAATILAIGALAAMGWTAGEWIFAYLMWLVVVP